VTLTLIALLAVQTLASFLLVLAGGTALFIYVHLWRVPLVPR
jgi:hypothetical protein